MTIRFVALGSTMPLDGRAADVFIAALAAAEPCSVVGVLERDFAADLSHRLTIRCYSVEPQRYLAACDDSSCARGSLSRLRVGRGTELPRRCGGAPVEEQRDDRGVDGPLRGSAVSARWEAAAGAARMEAGGEHIGAFFGGEAPVLAAETASVGGRSGGSLRELGERSRGRPGTRVAGRAVAPSPRDRPGHEQRRGAFVCLLGLPSNPVVVAVPSRLGFVDVW